MKHQYGIPLAKRGTLGKITEEYAELLDAEAQQDNFHSVLELADLTQAIAAYSLRKYHLPFTILIVFSIAFRCWKLITRKIPDALFPGRKARMLKKAGKI